MNLALFKSKCLTQVSTLVCTINYHSLGVHKAVLKFYSLLNNYHYERITFKSNKRELS